MEIGFLFFVFYSYHSKKQIRVGLFGPVGLRLLFSSPGVCFFVIDTKKRIFMLFGSRKPLA